MNGLALDGPLARGGSNRRVRINVGGKIFETTAATLQSAGKSSLLARSAPTLPSDSAEIFFDRDPQLFAPLLTLLRTDRLPAAAAAADADRDALLEEAHYYGVAGALRTALAPPPLDGLDAERVSVVHAGGRDRPSALRAAGDGSLWVGHGSKITAFDWALRRGPTTLTELPVVESMDAISPTRAAVGASDFAGLHIYDVRSGAHVKTVTWSDRNDTRIYRSCVRAVASSPSAVFAAFESGQHTDNVILMFDHETLSPVREIGRQRGNSAHSKVATVLRYVASKGLIMAAGVHGGAFGYSGYVRLWDLRAEEPVWEWTEPNATMDPRTTERDSFADVAVSEEMGSLFKVGVISGGLAMAELRRIGAQGNPWVSMTETNPALGVKGGAADARLLSYGRQVFCSRGGDLEVWSELPVEGEKEYSETSFRRNFVEQGRSHAGQEVTAMAGGGDRLFVARAEMQGIEVWESRRLVSDDLF